MARNAFTNTGARRLYTTYTYTYTYTLLLPPSLNFFIVHTFFKACTKFHYITFSRYYVYATLRTWSPFFQMDPQIFFVQRSKFKFSHIKFFTFAITPSILNFLLFVLFCNFQFNFCSCFWNSLFFIVKQMLSSFDWTILWFECYEIRKEKTVAVFVLVMFS